MAGWRPRRLKFRWERETQESVPKSAWGASAPCTNSTTRFALTGMEPWSRAKSSPRWACSQTGALAVDVPPCRSALAMAQRLAWWLHCGAVIGCSPGFKIPGSAAIRTRTALSVRLVACERCPCHLITHDRARRPALQRERRQEAVEDPPFISSRSRLPSFRRLLLPFVRGGPMRAPRLAAGGVALWGWPGISRAPQPNQAPATRRLVTACPSFRRRLSIKALS